VDGRGWAPHRGVAVAGHDQRCGPRRHRGAHLVVRSSVWAALARASGRESGRGGYRNRAEVSTAVVVQAYRFALDPTAVQARDVQRAAGAARFAFNWALAAVKANIDQRQAERSYGMDGEQRTPVLGWNLPALRRRWNQAKDQVAPWWRECSKEAFNTGLDGVA